MKATNLMVMEGVKKWSTLDVKFVRYATRFSNAYKVHNSVHVQR